MPRLLGDHREKRPSRKDSVSSKAMRQTIQWRVVIPSVRVGVRSMPILNLMDENPRGKARHERWLDSLPSNEKLRRLFDTATFFEKKIDR
jgi:hypothetical protein